MYSPDGQKIVFVKGVNGDTEIYTMNTKGIIERRLTNNDFVDDAPYWQPINLATVGGISTSINKLEILAFYIVLAGLIIAISAVYVIKKHRITDFLFPFLLRFDLS